MSEKTSQKRRGIQSVTIGMRVLEAVASMKGPATLTAISQRAELSASQTHRYLSSLIEAGMLRQSNKSGTYDLDAGAIRLGLTALSRMDTFANADAYIRRLVDTTQRTCLVAVMGDAGPTVVRWYSGSPPVLTSLGIGSVLPLMRSATGRVFFSFGDSAEMDRQLQLLRLTDPAGAPLNAKAMRQKIRAQKLETLSGDLIPGLRAAAAPVFDLQGNLKLVVTLIAGAAFPVSEDEAAQTELLQHCRDLTESLGGQWPD
ncbi:IclR family transcriptional regulator [Henriciella aquimarina]|uniref:IclR family transcriptional regulator n=1 Tax=Henriciella aquimarina TaxID=545261 RepID=UPI00117A7DB8|nr:IclR family transcriptional regulator [Henriciella aquimarina]